jgi:hypothetical protein
MTVEATISSLQALISLIDESTPRSTTPARASSPSPSKQLQQLALKADCASHVGHASCACIAAIIKLHVRPDGVLQACGILATVDCSAVQSHMCSNTFPVRLQHHFFCSFDCMVTVKLSNSPLDSNL